MANLWAKKSITDIQQESIEEKGGLKRTLGPVSLVALGIGAIIGAGLFSITGGAAATNAGPAVTISFVIAAMACGFAGLCYAEFASMIPIAGSRDDDPRVGQRLYLFLCYNGRIYRLDHWLGPCS